MAKVSKWCRNIAENFNRLSMAHERYRRQADRQTDRQTDGRTKIHNEREREFTFAKNRFTDNDDDDDDDDDNSSSMRIESGPKSKLSYCGL